jgi:phosphatidylglycerophosphate synthase
MLDGALKPRIDPLLARAAALLARRNVPADAVTLLGLVLGLACAGLVAAAAHPALALAVLALSRLADGVDGALARATRPTDFGGFLDILCDFAFYGALPLAFALRDPAANALAAAALLFAFYVNAASFLGFAAVAARRGLDDAPRGPKSLVFSTGLMEATETYLFFAAMILWPRWFAELAWLFAALCLVTAALRVTDAARRLR